MTDLQSQVKAPIVQAPIAWVARRLLASDLSVQAVMVVGYGGKVLAHEIAQDFDEVDSSKESHSMLYYAPAPGLLFYVRLSKTPTDQAISYRVEQIINSPTFAITR
jgi:hypothetical protein